MGTLISTTERAAQECARNLPIVPDDPCAAGKHVASGKDQVPEMRPDNACVASESLE
jgi:hypothetical protein